MKKSVLPVLFFLFAVLNSHAEFSGVLDHELAINKDGKAGKFELVFKPEWNISLSETSSFTILGRVRYDAVGKLGSSRQPDASSSELNNLSLLSRHSEINLREVYLDVEKDVFYGRIGKQQVVWGQADGLKVLDVINPQSFREFILDDFDNSRLPLWMLNIEIALSTEANLQFLWIPDMTFNEFAEMGSTFEFTSPSLVPELPLETQLPVKLSQSKPKSSLSNSDYGLKFSLFTHGWDLSFNYFFHYLDNPLFFSRINDNNIELSSTYKRSHLIGFSASNVFGDFTVRTEFGYNSKKYFPGYMSPINSVFESPEISSVVGLDWQGIENNLISFQWFQSYLFKNSELIIRKKNTNIMSFLYKVNFENETWDMEILILHEASERDGLVQARLSYFLESNLKIWLGSDIFYGAGNGLFGQFNSKDRLTLGYEWGL